LNIFVGNLSHLVTKEEVQAVFSRYGQVESVVVTPDQYADVRPARYKERDVIATSRAYCYVDMPNVREALAALDALNGATLKDRRINVVQALPLKSKGKKELQRRPHLPETVPPEHFA